MGWSREAGRDAGAEVGLAVFGVFDVIGLVVVDLDCFHYCSGLMSRG
jgi:hypothetical protein